MGKNRLEAFSDGVIAVAITLLVLDIAVPEPDRLGHHSLAHELVKNWPTYAAYITSFLSIGIIWINHHAMISRLRATDHVILILNLMLLMSIGVIPFATDLVAQYLREGGNSHLAAGIYSGTFLVMGACFSALNRHILIHKAHLMRDPASAEHRLRVWRRAAAGVFPYLVAVAVAPLSAYASLGICLALAIFYAFPFASSVALDPGGEIE